MNFRTAASILFGVLLIIGPMSWSQSDIGGSETDPLLVEASVVPFDWSPGQGGTLELRMKLPKNFHAYEDKFSVVILEPDGFKVTTPLITPVVEWFDKFSKKNRRGIKDQATLKAHLEAPDRFLKKYEALKLELTYQACSDQFCLFPTTKLVTIPIRVAGVADEPQFVNPSEKTEGSPTLEMISTSVLSKYMSDGLGFALLIAFLAGILTSFTPCIFPMIPITLAVLGNHSNERTRLQNFITSCIYVLGIATTYSILGLAAASSGSLFGATLGNPYVLSVVCIIFLTMALSMYGLFDVQVPAFVRDRFGRSKTQGGMVNAYLTGLFAGIVASPCVGPVLVSILTHVASTQDHLRGFLLLFFYALGLGMIFIALGLSSNLTKLLPRSGPWMNFIKFALGSLMLSAFYYYLSLLFPDRWFDASLGVGLIIIGSVYGAFIAGESHSVVLHLRKGIMLATLLIGVGYLSLAVFDLRPYIRAQMIGTHSLNQIQTLQWQPYSLQALEQATKDKKPVIIDFWADWCAACHELEEKTFTDPRVRSFSLNYVLLKFDATTDSAELKTLKQKYKIQGLPTVIFINPHGVWLDSLTLTQFEDAPRFLKRMEKAAQ